MAKKRFGLQQALREAAVTDATYYRRRKECGGVRGNQAERLKELERESPRLKKLVAELSLEKAILKDMAEGNF
jgi:putative transposase